jgi:predicted acetyltransferase
VSTIPKTSRAACVVAFQKPIEIREVSMRQFCVVCTRRRHGIGRSAMQSLLSDIWPRTKRRTVSVLVHNASGVAFWRAMGYQDYALTLEIMPGAPPHS